MNILGLKIAVDRNPSAKIRWTRRAGVIGVLNVFVVGTGVAIAAWTVTGTGSGTAAAGSATALSTVSATATSLGLLYPDGPNADLKVTFDNPNTFPVKITNLSAGSGSVTGSGGTGTCTTTGVSVIAQTGQTVVVAAKTGGVDGQTTFTFLNAVKMDNTSDNGCQNATFTVPVSFTGASN